MENREQNIEAKGELQEMTAVGSEAVAVKKKKGKKGKWIVLGVLAGALCIGGIWYGVWGRKLLMPSQNTGVDIVAKEGQEIIYARIESINGNEITYTVTNMPVMNADSSSEASRGNGRGENGFQMPDFEGGEMPEGMEKPNFEGGGMPGFGGGEMPEGMEMPNFEGGEMPDFEGGGMPGFGGGEMPEGMERPDGTGENDGKRPQRENMMPGEEAETVTAYIPVGTEVTTKLGTVTTFSRLAAGDYVALVVEQDGDEPVIMAVYIVG